MDRERWEYLKALVCILDPQMRTGWSSWTDIMCWAYATYPYIAALGCTASTKTHTFCKFAFADYFSSPLSTLVTCTTTNSSGLDQRIWPLMAQSYRLVQGDTLDWKMRVSPQKTIQPCSEDGKHGIRCQPIEEKADKQRIIDLLIGVHPKRRIWLVDEATSAPQAVLEAWANAMAATSHKRMVMLGNPDEQFDALANFCRPINGWDSVNEDSDKWEFEFYGEKGIALHFDGRKSPNLQHPRKKDGSSHWPFLYGHADFTAHTAAKELQPKVFYRMCVGFYMPEGISRRIMTFGMIDKHKSREHALFEGDVTFIASLDPAFGGDRAIFRLWKVGFDLESKNTVMDALKPMEIPVDPKGLPGEQIGKFCLLEMNRVGCKIIGIDTTTNNSAVSEWMKLNTSFKIINVPFGGKASERPVSDSDPRPCDEAYSNFVSELWFSAANYLPQIRGIDQETAIELCSRYWDSVGDKPTRQRVETKGDFKDRMRKSPDLADNLVIGVEVFRQEFKSIKTPTNEAKSKRWNSAVKRRSFLHQTSYS